jgi:hypothetical protein
MIAVVPAVVMSTMVLQMTLLTEDASRSDATSLVLAENMARYHNGAYHEALAAQNSGTLVAGVIPYTLVYPFRPLASWTTEVATDGATEWVVTFPADYGDWQPADMQAVIGIFEEQGYSEGSAGHATSTNFDLWQLPTLITVMPEGAPVIVTPLPNGDAG